MDRNAVDRIFIDFMGKEVDYAYLLSGPRGREKSFFEKVRFGGKELGLFERY
ncbi:MAG: hypothetical protein ACQGQO_07220 [Sphaerochaetaceae bacterium]